MSGRIREALIHVSNVYQVSGTNCGDLVVHPALDNVGIFRIDTYSVSTLPRVLNID
jgi:hypothetical protein